MKEFSLDLLEGKYRPVVKVDLELNALVDTGAIYPVFTIPLGLLKRNFEAKLVMSNVTFGGFGGDSKADVYSIEDFKVGELNFKHIEVMVPHEPQVRYPVILSAAMFWGLRYTVDTKAHKFIVQIPDDEPLDRDFRIKELRNELCVQVNDVLLQDQGIFFSNEWIDW